ncbi:predicted protein [Plenodomus lingam JN3]|uniref:Predicted protein n=1 Tax=Leptosphaeria maculans (strain JN3 / isolate v23.1.3 / race Av1-4-5-6-7-8) TaxID=985895 RepID=E5A8K5_LEPMJ|nr:predicted protein [Plenodomus lingam JN3]CBX99950.1 predicted protein [Plenodomus lingam JN3]
MKVTTALALPVFCRSEVHVYLICASPHPEIGKVTTGNCHILLCYMFSTGKEICAESRSI